MICEEGEGESRPLFAFGREHRMEECIEVIDGQGRVVDVLPRTQVHVRGLRHRVVHVWVYAWEQETCWVYLQRRSFEKQQAPGLYDWTATGHVDPGESMRAAAVRECHEEVGLSLCPEALVLAGVQNLCAQTPQGIDDEQCHVFVARVDAPCFAPGDEVIAMKRTPLCQLQQMACGQRARLTLYDLHGGASICIARTDFSGFCETYVRMACEAILSQRRI